MADYQDPISAFLASMSARSPAPAGGAVAPYQFQPQINPIELQGAPAAPGVTGVLGNLNPYARAMIAAAGVMQPSPTAANDQAPTDAWFQKPSGVGGMPGPSVPPTPTSASYDPLSSIQAPAAPITIPPMTVSSSAAQPSRPVTPTPVASTKKRIDPASVDLGKVPRFTTVQYQVPSGRGPLSSNPIYTALNLGGSS